MNGSRAAAALVAQSVSLRQSLATAHFGSADEIDRRCDPYIAYTKARPELRALYDDAAAVKAELVAAFDAAEIERQAAELELEVAKAQNERPLQDKVRLLRVGVPEPLKAMAGIGEVAAPAAAVTHFVATFLPVIGPAVLALEAISGHGALGIGETLEDGQRVDQAVMAGILVAAPLAGKILAAGARGAQAVIEIAAASNQTTARVIHVLQGLRSLLPDLQLLRQASKLVSRAEPLSTAESEVVSQAARRLATMESPAVEDDIKEMVEGVFEKLKVNLAATGDAALEQSLQQAMLDEYSVRLSQRLAAVPAKRRAEIARILNNVVLDEDNRVALVSGDAKATGGYVHPNQTTYVASGLRNNPPALMAMLDHENFHAIDMNREESFLRRVIDLFRVRSLIEASETGAYTGQHELVNVAIQRAGIRAQLAERVVDEAALPVTAERRRQLIDWILSLGSGGEPPPTLEGLSKGELADLLADVEKITQHHIKKGDVFLTPAMLRARDEFVGRMLKDYATKIADEEAGNRKRIFVLLALLAGASLAIAEYEHVGKSSSPPR